MRISSIAPFAASAALALAARADVARSNECFAVAWNSANGALASLVVNGDADRMNWISGLESWGEIRTNVKKIGGRDGWTGAAFRDSEKLPFRGMREEGDRVTMGCRVERDAPVGYARPLIEPYVQFSRIRLSVWDP